MHHGECDFPVVISLLWYPNPNHPRYMDLINVMTYDLRGSWEGFTGENSPLFAGPGDQGDYKFFNVVSDETDSGQPVILGVFEACPWGHWPRTLDGQEEDSSFS